MAAAPEDDPPGYDEAEVREFFNEFDGNGSGNVDPDEFRLLCEKLQPGMEEEEKDAALEALDGDGDGEISFDGASPHAWSATSAVAPRAAQQPLLTRCLRRLRTEFSNWWRDQMRAAALEDGDGAGADSATEVQNLQTIAEPVKPEPVKR
jgi:hypothetical protein